MFTPEGMELIDDIRECLDIHGTIIPAFVQSIEDNSTYEYSKIGTSTRVCVMTLYSGHVLVGYARSIDPSKDNEELGNRAARKNIGNQLWDLLVTIAKLMKI